MNGPTARISLAEIPLGDLDRAGGSRDNHRAVFACVTHATGSWPPLTGPAPLRARPGMTVDGTNSRPPEPVRGQLRWRLMGILAVNLLLMVLLLGAGVVRYIRTTEVASWHGRQGEAARSAAGTVAGFIQSSQEALTYLSLLDRDASDTQSSIMNRHLEGSSSFLEVVRVDSLGGVIASSSVGDAVLVNPLTIPRSRWYLEAAAGRPFLGHVYESEQSEPYLIIARPAEGGDVIAARLRMLVLWDVVRDIRFGASGQVFVVDNRGSIVVHTDDQVVARGENIAERSEYAPMWQALGQEWYGEYLSLSGQDVVGATATIPGTDWMVVTELERDEAYASSRMALTTLGGAALLAAILVALASLDYLNRSVVGPVEQLRDSAERIGRGDLNHRVESTAKDEIGQVARAFDDMAARLQEREAQIAFQTGALRASEGRYRAIVEDQTELICRTMPDGTLTFVNEAFCRYFGRTRETLLGRSFTPPMPEEDLERVRAEMRRLGRETIVVSYEHRVMMPDGSLRWQHWTSRALFAEHSKPVEIQSVGRDITERRLTEEALRRAHDELERRVAERTKDLSRSMGQLQAEVQERTRAEKAWQSSEARLRRITDNMLDVIVQVDAGWHLQYASPSFRILLGYEPAKMEGRSFLELIHPQDPFLVLHTGKPDSREMEPFTAELKVRHADGHYLWMEAVVNPLVDVEGEMVGAIIAARGISQRKQAEEAQLRYAQRLATLQEIDRAVLAARSPEEIARAALTGIRRLVPYERSSLLLFDFERGEARVLVTVGDAGSGPEEGTSMPLSALGELERMKQGQSECHPDLAAVPSRSHFLERLVLAGMRCAASSPLIVEGVLIGCFNLAKKQADAFDQEQLQIAREVANQLAIALGQSNLREGLAIEQWRLQVLVEHLPEGVVLLDREKRLVLANPAARESLPDLTEASLGDHLTHLAGKQIESLVTSSQETTWTELTLSGPVARVFEVAVRRLEAASVTQGWVLVLRDMTEERALQALSEQQGRLAAVGQLAAGIAHDFNNIVAAITLYCEMVLATPGLPPKTSERVSTILEQAGRAVDLTRQILDFSRQGIMEPQALQLLPFLKELQKLLRRTLPETIRLGLNYDSDEYVVSADPARLQQVFLNLSLNARDAMAGDGRLTFDLSRLTLRPDDPRPFPEMLTGDWVVLKVSDTGAGIPPQILPRIFEPFFTTKPAGKGTGLGLAQVYGIVQQHNGHILVTSRLGEGTTFTIYLPLLKCPAPFLDDESPGETTRGKGELILLVEDDPGVRGALREVLERSDYRVVEAEDGLQALGTYEEIGADIQLVVSDLVMPKMDGKALYRAVREHNSEAKILFVTGYPLGRGTSELLEQERVAWLQKPINSKTLTLTIRSLLDKVPARQESAPSEALEAAHPQA